MWEIIAHQPGTGIGHSVGTYDRRTCRRLIKRFRKLGNGLRYGVIRWS